MCNLMAICESLKNPDILAAFLTDLSPISFALSSSSEGMKLKGLWKHTNSLCVN